MTIAWYEGPREAALEASAGDLSDRDWGSSASPVSAISSKREVPWPSISWTDESRIGDMGLSSSSAGGDDEEGPLELLLGFPNPQGEPHHFRLAQRIRRTSRARNAMLPTVIPAMDPPRKWWLRRGGRGWAVTGVVVLDELRERMGTRFWLRVSSKRHGETEKLEAS